MRIIINKKIADYTEIFSNRLEEYNHYIERQTKQFKLCSLEQYLEETFNDYVSWGHAFKEGLKMEREIYDRDHKESDTKMYYKMQSYADLSFRGYLILFKKFKCDLTNEKIPDGDEYYSLTTTNGTVNICKTAMEQLKNYEN